MRIKTCPICGKEFESHTSAKCCSEECRVERERQYRLAYEEKHREERQKSKVEYGKLRREKERKARESRPPKRLEDIEVYGRICPECGKPFRTAFSWKIFCGRRCKDTWNRKRPEERFDLRIEKNRKLMEERRKTALERQEEILRIRQEQERHRKFEMEKVKRTESGAVWYPVSGREIQRIARETHRSYGEVCAEFLSRQVRCADPEARP